jgi:hypothetical protein
VLCLPELAVDSYVTITRVPFDAEHMSLPDYVARLGACASYDANCQRVVAESNPGVNLGVPQFKGAVNLPIRAYRVTLPVDSHQHLERLAAELDVLARDCKRSGLVSGEDKLEYAVVPSTQKFDAADLTTGQEDPPGDYIEAPRQCRSFAPSTAARCRTCTWRSGMTRGLPTLRLRFAGGRRHRAGRGSGSRSGRPA